MPVAKGDWSDFAVDFGFVATPDFAVGRSPVELVAVEAIVVASVSVVSLGFAPVAVSAPVLVERHPAVGLGFAGLERRSETAVVGFTLVVAIRRSLLPH